MKNLCDTCKLASWDLHSVENAECNSNSNKGKIKVITEEGYVNICTCYEARNIFYKIVYLLRKEQCHGGLNEGKKH